MPRPGWIERQAKSSEEDCGSIPDWLKGPEHEPKDFEWCLQDIDRMLVDAHKGGPLRVQLSNPRGFKVAFQFETKDDVDEFLKTLRQAREKL